MPQAVAAAALLDDLGPMDGEPVKVWAASQRRFASLLDTEISSTMHRGSRLVILGVPVGRDPETLVCLRESLLRLQKKNVDVHWFGFREHVPVGSDLRTLWREHIAEVRHAFPAFVLREMGAKKAPRRDLIKMAEAADSVGREGVTDALQERIMLVRAALYEAGQQGDFEQYAAVIRLLAANQPPDDNLKRMLERFRRFGHREFVGRSSTARKVCDLARRIGAEGTCSVLITGETGVGKETVAELIHQHSLRRDEAFKPFNCADLNPELLTSRLFGYEKGAFTGAGEGRPGVFETADGGTVFLDEIGDLPLGAQAMLLRVLQEGQFSRLGGEAGQPVKTDVRVVAATHRDLRHMVKSGTFREDLYYRISAVCLHVPALRERIEDLREIAESFFRSRGWKVELGPPQWDLLEKHPWPGNVREFQNVLTRLHVLKETDIAKVLDTFPCAAEGPADETLDAAIRRHVKAVYDRCGRNKTHAARALGIAVNTLKAYLA